MAVSAMLVAGCGGPAGPTLASVKGIVTKGGKPLAGVSVTFTQVEKNFSAAGLTNSDGAFVLIAQNGQAGALPGENKVTLAKQSSDASSVNPADSSSMEKMMRQREGSMQTAKKGAPALTDGDKEIPPEYKNPGKTPLSFKVASGSNSFDIAIP